MTQKELIVGPLGRRRRAFAGQERVQKIDPRTASPVSIKNLRPKRNRVLAGAPASQRTMDESSNEEVATTPVHTYHCICHTLILAVCDNLGSFPPRVSSKDVAVIVGPASQYHVVHVIEEHKSIIIRRDDGFEKRTLLRCERCRLVVAYKLDVNHFEDGHRETGSETLYVLPGALVETKAMIEDEKPEVPTWAREA